jgi:hypothetical protein
MAETQVVPVDNIQVAEVAVVSGKIPVEVVAVLVLQ